MAKQQKAGQANVPSKGLNKDNWSLGEADYVHLQNGNFDNFDGGTFTLTNEMSNILSSKFKTGFKVIGFINDLNTENTYFFLTNPTTKVSEFGVIKSNQNNNNLNSSRYINIDRIADYFIDEVSCEDDLQLDCPDFSKMLIFKQFSIPKLTP